MDQAFISLLCERGYSVFDYIECRNCTVFILKKTEGNSRKKVVLKLFTGQNAVDAWRNAYKFRCEKLGEYSYDEARIPHALSFWDNETYNGTTTFGVLVDYISGRTLDVALYNDLDNDGDRREMLLRVIPDFIDDLLFGNKAGYYHLDVDGGNLLVDVHDRGWLIDHIGAFICEDYCSGKMPEGGYFHCYSDRIAPTLSRADEFAERGKDDGWFCECLQTVLLLNLMKGLFDSKKINTVYKRCISDRNSPLQTLRQSLSEFE